MSTITITISIVKVVATNNLSLSFLRTIATPHVHLSYLGVAEITSCSIDISSKILGLGCRLNTCNTLMHKLKEIFINNSSSSR